MSNVHVLCRAFDLLLQSDRAIPGALPTSESQPPDTVPDIRVQAGETTLSGELRRSGPYQLGCEGLLFERSGVARFLCNQAGSTVHMEVLPGATEADADGYLIATALPAALWLRGDLVLHAAAAVLPGAQQAIALLGVSGSGKSALLQSIVNAGGAVVTEDSLCIRTHDNRIFGSGLPGCLHVRAADAPLLAERTVIDLPGSQSRPRAELSALVVLDPVEGSHPRDPLALEPAAALAALLRHRHRPRIPELLNLSGALLPRWAALAKTVPVYSWKFPQSSLSADGREALWHRLIGLSESGSAANAR